jgi:hypothetical protein
MITSNTMMEARLKVKASVLVLLLSLIVLLSPQPVAAAGLTLNPVQGVVGAEVAILNIGGYGTGEYQIYWGDARQLLGQGSTAGITNVTFIVPESARGKQKVTLKLGANVYDGEFTVLPSIKTGAKEGYVGSSLSISGSGFNANETNIEVTYGGTTVASGIASDGKGNWQITLAIPPTRGGAVTIDAGSSLTPVTEVDNRSFTVLPKMDINPIAGGVGTLVMANGTGFGTSESGIAIVFDGLKVKTGIAADSKGTWQSSFYVPTSAKGRHRINSSGDTTADAAVSGVTFSVSPALKLELVSGQLGDIIKVGDDFWASGIGFEENESGIQVTFDGVMLASSITADAKGTWAVQLKVPLTSRGKHIIDAAGNTTKAGDVADSTLIVSPQMEINPASGGIGSDIVVKGTGFSANQSLVVTYDSTQVVSSQNVDGKGNFQVTFKVPKGKSGNHLVTVTDASGSVASAIFKTETTPPPVPKQISPEVGSKFGMVGKTVVAFGWTGVEDPSGVSYEMEISSSPDFTGTMLRKESLNEPQYTLAEDEALPDGSYYWRVKAIDGAGNESNWSAGHLFTIGGQLWVFGVIFGAVIILALIIWRVISLRNRGWK